MNGEQVSSLKEAVVVFMSVLTPIIPLWTD